MKHLEPSDAMRHIEGRFALISVAAEALTPQGQSFDKGFDLARAISDLANDSANDCLDLAKEYAEIERRMSEERKAG